MAAKVPAANKLNLAQCEQWDDRDLEAFREDPELQKEAAQPPPYERAQWELQSKLTKVLVEKGIFQGSLHRLPYRFSSEFTLQQKEHEPTPTRVPPFPITRTASHNSSFPTPTWVSKKEGVIIQRENGEPIVLYFDYPFWTTGEGRLSHLLKQLDFYSEACDRVGTILLLSDMSSATWRGLSPPLIRLVHQYLDFTPQPPLPQNAERMFHIRNELITSFNSHVCKSYPNEGDFYTAWYHQHDLHIQHRGCQYFGVKTYETIAGTIAQFLDETTVEETSPKDLCLAVGRAREIELPFHLKLMDVNAQDEQGMTALHHAASNCWNGKVVQELLQLNADCNIRCKEGTTPLDVALSVRVYDYWEKGGEDEYLCPSDWLLDGTKKSEITLQTVRRAVVNGHVKFLTQFAQRIGDFNRFRDAEGNSAAHWLLTDNEQAIQRRFEHDGNRNVYTSYEVSYPTHITRVGMLKKLGVDFRAQNNQGLTPLHIALGNRDLIWIQALGKTQDDLNIQDRYGNTPYMWYLFEGSPEAAEAELTQEFVALKEKAAAYFRLKFHQLCRFLS